MRQPSRLAYTESSAINIDVWLHNIALERLNSDREQLRKACELAEFAGREILAEHGDTCLHQGLAMAEILSDLNLDDDTLAAAIVYSATQYADLKLDVVSEHLGSVVTKLINGAQQMDALHALHEKLSRRAHLATTIDNLRKMLLAMVDDVRVVFIKLAERLCVLRNLLNFSDAEKERYAKETMDIYAPLANRLGIGHLKWQLEDLSFRYLKPTEYQALSRGLKDRRIDRESYVKNLITTLHEELDLAGVVDAKVSGRAKHIYSIYRKMQRKNVTLDEIYDAIAFRILVPTLDDCYSALSIVHALWSHIPSEFDDYITHPKPNGYRSIHTAVVGPLDKYVEIQIRTYDMHREAELGVAAHWAYKEGVTPTTSYDQKIAWLRGVLDWQKEVTEDEKDFSRIFEDQIYVFTPNGDVIDLPAGATPLDFAYQIHSELGSRCRGAKVNGVIVPLHYALKSGEKVEILTAKQAHPSRDWLNPQLGYLKTSRAKAKVVNWFRKQDYDQHLLEGQELVEKEFRRLHLKELAYEDLANKLNFNSKEEMFVALGRGDLRLHNVLVAVQMLVPSTILPEKQTTVPSTFKLKPEIASTDIIIEGVSNLMIHLARCCKPIPGDAIVGYVTIGKGISIHREDCFNIVEKTSLYPGRKMQVSWGSQTQKKYPVDLSIVANNTTDLTHEITTLLANEHFPLLSIQVVPHRKKLTVMVYLTIEVDNLHPLSRIVTRLLQIPSVLNVQRE